MHVVLLSHEYPPFIYGGVGSFVQNLAKGLSKINLKVTVISGYPVSNVLRKFYSYEGFQESIDGIRVLRFPYLNSPPAHTMFQLSNLKQLSKVIQETDPDVIHGQSGSTFPLSAFIGNTFPLIVTFHTSPKVERTLSIYSLLRGWSCRDFLTYVIGYPSWSLTFKKELKQSRLAVAVSKNLKLDLLSEMGKGYNEKIRVIHNGIEIEALEKEFKKEANLGESDNTILFAGRFFWRKGALVLIRLASLFREKNLNFKIIVHGDGPLFKRVKRKIETLKLTNIELKGFTNRAQLIKSMKISRFVLIPSFYEACPMILLESMCLGKIPVMFSLPYSLEFTENGKYGIIARNPEDMVKKLKTALVELDIESFSEKLKDFARREYDIKNTASRYLDAYKTVCD